MLRTVDAVQGELFAADHGDASGTDPVGRFSSGRSSDRRAQVALADTPSLRSDKTSVETTELASVVCHSLKRYRGPSVFGKRNPQPSDAIISRSRPHPKPSAGVSGPPSSEPRPS